jgi:hypothetical protein
MNFRRTSTCHSGGIKLFTLAGGAFSGKVVAGFPLENATN